MPSLTLALILVTIFAHAQDSLKIARSNYDKLSWLIGTWNRTNGRPGRTTTEKWEVAGNYVMKGTGITLKGQDTAFVEKIKIIIKDHNIYYVADVPGNAGEVFFKFTAIGNNSFTCEDPQHDFPKKITYTLEGTTLKATISADGKAIEYLFQH